MRAAELTRTVKGRSNIRSAGATVLILLAAGLMLVGCRPMTQPSEASSLVRVGNGVIADRSASQAPLDVGRTGSGAAALMQLELLPVKGKAPKTGYERAEKFGSPWTDDSDAPLAHNGCDTRSDIIMRDLVDRTYKSNSKCVVLKGTLHDQYTGTTIAYVRGPQTSSAVQVDHVVALSNAWQTGAQQLIQQQRISLANDPRNLQAVQGRANQQKSDQDTASWLPPNKSYRCTYVSRQIQVKRIYRLWVTPAEKAAMIRVLQNC